MYVRRFVAGRDRPEVRTLRCGRNNPGSNPGHGTLTFFLSWLFSLNLFLKCDQQFQSSDRYAIFITVSCFFDNVHLVASFPGL